MSTPDVYRAICAVSKAVGHDGIAKNSKNEQQGYKFRGIDDMYNGLSLALSGAGLCILPRMISRSQEERVTAKGGLLFYVTVQAEFDFVASADGSKHTITMFGEAMDSGDKATNKAMSAAYKYACMQAFCIPTEGLNEDADATTHTPAPKATAQPVQSQHPRDAQRQTPTPKATPAPKPQATPSAPMTTEQQLRRSIDDAVGKIYERYEALDAKSTFKSILGSHGYTDPSEIPADYSKAKGVIDELKATLKDLVPA